MVKTGIGQDSHRFEDNESGKPLVLGGIHIPGCPGLAGNSDADVVLHALTNALSSVSGVVVLGGISDELCLKKGIKDSKVYLDQALSTCAGYRVVHAAITVEAARPRLAPYLEVLRESVAHCLRVEKRDIGITATTGEDLTAFGRGEGIQVFAIVTLERVIP